MHFYRHRTTAAAFSFNREVQAAVAAYSRDCVSLLMRCDARKAGAFVHKEIQRAIIRVDIDSFSSKILERNMRVGAIVNDLDFLRCRM